MGFPNGGSGGSSISPIAFGTAAGRPAAATGNANTGYYATDTGEITFSDGTIWYTVGQITGPLIVKRPGASTGAALLEVVDNAAAMLAQVLDNGEFNWGSDPVSSRLRSGGGGPIFGGDTNCEGGVFTAASGSVQPNGNAGIWSGSGAPAAGLGANGDIYLNQIGGAGTTIYQKRAGAWVGIV